MSTIRTTWLDSVTPGVLGTKVYRDDIEIADVGNGVQTYDDTTALEDTTYKYEVQAYTIDGESTDEVQGVNVENITTSPGIIDLYPTGNGASLVPNEGNSIGPWTGNSNGVASVSTDNPQNGLYTIRITSTGGGTPRVEYTILGLINGVDYTFSWKDRRNNLVTSQQIRFTGFAQNPTNLSMLETWSTKNVVLTAGDGSTTIKMICYLSFTESLVGMWAEIDELSIVAV